MNGDKYDKIKWDFPEDSLKKIYVDGYLYKVKDPLSVHKLVYIRSEINRLCKSMELIDMNLLNKLMLKYPVKNSNIQEFIESIKIFLDILQEKQRYFEAYQFKKRINNYNTVSKYLLSEMPIISKDRPQFTGISKPRDIFFSEGPNVGPDKNLRCLYRDIFLTLDSNIISLVLHELSHVGCSHVTYKDTGHANDFNRFEELLKIKAKEIEFLKNYH